MARCGRSALRLEAAARAGFVEEAQYRQLAANAHSLWLRALLACAYNFGFRKGELLKLRVRQVSLADRLIQLNAGETKSGEAREVEMTKEVFVLLQAAVSGKGPDDFVFTHKNGSPVKDFRDAWEALTTRAGLPELLFHDLPRSSVRNMVRRGVQEKVAMEISGHKTRAIFDRYNIVDRRDLSDTRQKIEAGQKPVTDRTPMGFPQILSSWRYADRDLFARHSLWPAFGIS